MPILQDNHLVAILSPNMLLAALRPAAPEGVAIERSNCKNKKPREMPLALAGLRRISALSRICVAIAARVAAL